MSTQLALGLAGAGIGFMLGGATGAYYGFVLGSLAGSLLDPPKTQGPRLGDTKLQKSTYGSQIPHFWGTGRVGGNVIDQTDLEKHEEKSSGKGGPENTEFTYSASFAILIGSARVFGEPAIRGINKIWADGRLIWDVATSSDPIPCTVYYGTEEQLPDPTFEAIHGVGEVPAHRGYAYVVFSDYYLTDFFNRIPNLEFEVFTEGGEYPWQVNVGTPWKEASFNIPGFKLEDGILTVAAGKSLSGDCYWKQYDMELNQIGDSIYTTVAGKTNGLVLDSLSHVNLETPSEYFWVTPNQLGFFIVGTDISVTGALTGNLCGAQNGFVYSIQAGAPAILEKYTEGGLLLGFVTISVAQNGNSMSLGMTDSEDDVYVVFANGGGSAEMWKFDEDLSLIKHWPNSEIAGTALDNAGGAGGNFVVYQNQIVFNTHVGSVEQISIVDIGAAPGYVLSDSTHGPLEQGFNGRLSYLGNGLIMNLNYGIFSMIGPPGPVFLSTIVGNLTDMTPAVGQYNATELTDEVPWFIIASLMTVRNAIQVLRPIYHFDAVESDDIIKYRKRSEVSTFEIPVEDLCGRVYGEESGTPLKLTRTREQEIPRTVTITYIDIERDYQIGTQSTTIQTRRSEQDTTIEVPVGLTQDQAYQKCWTLINAAWIERETFEWSTTRKWAHLEPCDVGLVHDRVIRIQTRVESPDGVIRWTGVLAAPSQFINDDSSIYFQPGTGAPSDGWVAPTPPSSLVATEMFLLDIPLLSSSDYPNGFYCAVGPAAVGRWPGAAVYKSVDGGTTYNVVGETLVSDTIATATSTLGNWTGGNNFDESNTLDVALNDPDNELDSYSEEAVLNGAGRFAIGSETAGWEIAQYKTATLTAPGVYTLSGFLRGRYGTEWMMGQHGPGETFILLPTTMNIEGLIGELNATRKYKAVTMGTPLADADAEDFTNTGVALKPYSVVHLEGGRNGSGDLIVEWMRRTRTGGVWLESIEVPLGEPPPALYLFRVYSSNTYATQVREVIVTPDSTYTYTAADQTTDFGSPQATIYTEVVQVGPYVDGYATRAAL